LLERYSLKAVANICIFLEIKNIFSFFSEKIDKNMK